MTTYIIGRLAQFVLVIVGALLAVFVAMNLVTDPAEVILPLGTPADVIEAFRENHGLADPIPERTVEFLANGLRGDFGDSIWLGGDALGHALDHLPATLMLTFPPVLIGGILGVLTGALSARRPESWFSQVTSTFSFGLLSIAEFWLGIMLVLIFAVELQVLPTGGYEPKPEVFVLPMIVLALRPFAQNYQLAQSTMTAEYGKQYVLACRARGLSERQVATRHVLKNVAVPVVTLLLYELGRVFAGAAIVVEIVFGWPGIGRLAVDALNRGDLFLVEAIVLVTAVIIAALNLLADLFYFVVDPRTRHLVKKGKR